MVNKQLMFEADCGKNLWVKCSRQIATCRRGRKETPFRVFELQAFFEPALERLITAEEKRRGLPRALMQMHLAAMDDGDRIQICLAAIAMAQQ